MNEGDKVENLILESLKRIEQKIDEANHRVTILETRREHELDARQELKVKTKGLEDRIVVLERMKYMILGGAGVLGFLGGFIVSLVMKFI